MAKRTKEDVKEAVRAALRQVQAPMPYIVTARGRETIAQAAAHERGERPESPRAEDRWWEEKPA